MTDTAPTPAALNDLPFIDAFLDIVIPPSRDAKFPGAGTLSLAAQVSQRLQADAMVGPFTMMGIQAIYAAGLERDPAGFIGLPASARLELVQAQLATNPMLMLGVGLHLYPAYYQHPKVLAAMDQPARAPFPEGFTVAPTAPELLESLQRRARHPGAS